MEHKSLYELSRGSTPEVGVVFCPDQKLFGGLSQADNLQLSQDYYANPWVFETIVRFRNQHIDEFEQLLGNFGRLMTQIDNQRDLDEEHRDLHNWAWGVDEDKIAALKAQGIDDLHYRQLPNWDWYKGDIQRVALRAAGKAIWQSKQQLDQNQEKFLISGDQFARKLAEYTRIKAPGENGIWIHGLLYQNWQDNLYTEEWENLQPEKRTHDTRLVLFSYNTDLVTAFARQNYQANQEAGRLRKGGRFIRFALLKDWQKLLHGLDLMGQF